MDNWLVSNLNDAMYELMCGLGSFWLISGPVLDELIAKSEAERKCIDLQNGAQSKNKELILKISSIVIQGI